MLRRPEQSVLRGDVMSSRQLAGRVRRYHTWPVLHQQTVGEHSARVATLYVEIFGLPRAEVLYHVLHHDSGEFYAGDPPFPVKQRHPAMKTGHSEAEAEGLRRLNVELPDLASFEQYRVKVCDLLEMHEFGAAELTMGNKYAEPVVRDTLDAVIKYVNAKFTSQPEDVELVMEWVRNNGVKT